MSLYSLCFLYFLIFLLFASAASVASGFLVGPGVSKYLFVCLGISSYFLIFVVSYAVASFFRFARGPRLLRGVS